MLALLYDIHGNLPALEAVLADAGNAGADRFLLGGDYALFGPFASETVAALRELGDATWIRGNVDRWSAHPEEAPDDDLVREAIEDCRNALGTDVVAELDALDEQLVIDGTRYCHASPISDLRSFMPAQAGEDEELLRGAAERRVVFGHTHLAFRRTGPSGIELVNPGSVGLPLDDDQRAAYAIVGDDDSIELRRVGYDVDAAITALERRFGGKPWATRSVNRLRTARL